MITNKTSLDALEALYQALQADTPADCISMRNIRGEFIK